MSSTNGCGKPAGMGLAPVSDSASEATTTGQHSRDTGEVQVLDQNLDVSDAKIVATLKLHSRTTKLVDVKVDRVVLESLELENRWILLQGIHHTLDDIRKITALKLKKKLGLEEQSSADKDQGGELPAEFTIHHPPPLNGAGW